MRFVLGLFIAALATTGCSDSTGPSSVAHHLDALYRQACAKAYVPSSGSGGFTNGPGYDMTSPYWQRCMLLNTLLAGPASGAEPSPVRVTTATGVETWQGVLIFEYDTANSGTPPSTTIYDLIVYSDPNVTTAIVSALTDFGNFTYIIANDTITENGTALSHTASRVSLGSPCHETSGLANPLANFLGFEYIEYSGAICRLATFDASVRATFPATPGMDASLESITIDPQSIDGISVVGNSLLYVERVKTPATR
jgi:hypothetical protein